MRAEILAFLEAGEQTTKDLADVLIEDRLTVHPVPQTAEAEGASCSAPIGLMVQ